MKQALHLRWGPRSFAPGSLAIMLGAVALLASMTFARESADLPEKNRPTDVLEHDLGLGAAVHGDGAGGLSVSYDGRTLLRLELVVSGRTGAADTELRGVPLVAARGVQPADLALPARTFTEGQAGGQRGPAGDDDRDGRLDEDPVDGLDNDGDGAVDEDFAAIGATMRVSIADLEPVGMNGSRLRSEFYWWPYYHVDRILFWNARIEDEQDREGVPSEPASFTASLDVQATVPLKIERRLVSPHVSVGRGAEREVVLAFVRHELDDGERRYLGVLRLDGATTRIDADQTRLVWPDLDTLRWPLAVVVARTEETLFFLAGQALLTYERDPRGPSGGVGISGREHWTVPPLCARCQDPHVQRLRIRLGRSGEDLVIGVEYDGLNREHIVSHEGLALGDVALARRLQQAERSRASYRLPMESPAARAILRHAVMGDVQPRVFMVSGVQATVDQLEVDVSTELRDLSDSGDAETASEELPSYLSPRLVDSWPNPFKESTTIRYEVPGTLEEAFDLEENQLQKLDPRSAPPFGENPLVRVKVYNVGGQLIRVLDEETRGPGEYAISWDGTDVQGRPVAAGAYYVNVEMGEWSVTRRVLRLKP